MFSSIFSSSFTASTPSLFWVTLAATPPATCNFSVGLVTPIPRLPEVLNLATSSKEELTWSHTLNAK